MARKRVAGPVPCTRQAALAHIDAFFHRHRIMPTMFFVVSRALCNNGRGVAVSAGEFVELEADLSVSEGLSRALWEP